MIARLALAAGAVLAMGAAPADWRPLDPQNTLVIDTSKGRIVVEMRPDLAPLAVARIKLLAREGVYDGLLFHRVIDGFVDQTGNPNNKDGGTSSHPDLPPEFTARLKPADIAVVRRATDEAAGFIGATPVAAEAEAVAKRREDGTFRAWGAYCPGVAGMGRQADEASANSEIFFMRDAARRLDRDYTVWGTAVAGLDVIRAINVGEPPADPDRMIRVRVAGDLPPADQPKIEVMDTAGPAFARLVAKARAEHGADFSVCDVAPPARSLAR
ncbi:peptidylprolyl isomerase [Phenylobacterium sp.]|uniref:peptidylprolyl isomerase n=1 Tax=Phenylobacterium sp. TaxID=1871053 RepID=UPI0035B2DED7